MFIIWNIIVPCAGLSFPATALEGLGDLSPIRAQHVEDLFNPRDVLQQPVSLVHGAVRCCVSLVHGASPAGGPDQCKQWVVFVLRPLVQHYE